MLKKRTLSLLIVGSVLAGCQDPVSMPDSGIESDAGGDYDSGYYDAGYSDSGTDAGCEAPEVTFSVAPAAVTGDSSARFEFSSSRADVTFECSVDDGLPSPCTSPFVGVFNEGDHQFKVFADAPCSSVRGAATHSWTVDFADPAGISPALAGVLRAHNRERASVGVGSLVWDAALAVFAQSWADRCDFMHRPNLLTAFDYPVGENIAMGSASSYSGQALAELWALERLDYDVATHTCAPGRICGHWTQMVWRDTLRMGCGIALCSGQNFLVCNYGPPGNYIGTRPF